MKGGGNEGGEKKKKGGERCTAKTNTKPTRALMGCRTYKMRLGKKEKGTLKNKKGQVFRRERKEIWGGRGSMKVRRVEGHGREKGGRGSTIRVQIGCTKTEKSLQKKGNFQQPAKTWLKARRLDE